VLPEDVPLHVIGVQGAAAVGADLGGRDGPVAPQPVEALPGAVFGQEVAALERRGLARMAAGAGLGEEGPAALDRAGTEVAVELRDQSARAREAARLPEVGGLARQEESRQVVQPVLDGAEAGAVAPALADLELGLPEVPL